MNKFKPFDYTRHSEKGEEKTRHFGGLARSIDKKEGSKHYLNLKSKALENKKGGMSSSQRKKYLAERDAYWS